MAATLYLVQAKQAYAAGQWQEVGRLTQLCINSARGDMALRNAALGLLSAALMQVGQLEQALPICLSLEQSLPNDANNLANIGHLLTQLKRHAEAISYLERAVKAAPIHAGTHLNLAIAYTANQQTDPAKASFLTAIQLDPTLAKAHYGLGEILLRQEGRISEALTAYERGLQLEPKNFIALSNLQFIQYFLYPHDLKQSAKVLQRYRQSVATIVPIKHLATEPHHPLRIGIVSADFCHHVVASFLDSTLAEIRGNPALKHRVTLVAYYNRNLHDEVTQRLRSRFDLWRQIEQASDEQVVQQIQHDQIDILIDLSGHTVGNRLPVFARKPAPLQISWLGWFGSTGLKAMDYVLADPISVPVAEESWFVEHIWRMPTLRYCFTPPLDAPEVSPPPCTTRDHVTFGCYQSLTKINDGVLRYWSQILTACPQARLRLQAVALAHPEQQARFLSQLQHAGIAIDHVDLVAGMSSTEYLASYADVDVLLDTFPYTGGTTTAEALWMGLPTLTLALPGMLGRQGEAFMRAVGLDDWVATSEADYIAKAIHWGQADHDARRSLTTLRHGLRARLVKSAAFNAQIFAVQWVDAMDAMWQDKIAAAHPSK
jgi:predicted O-linked N-acetylglucosamine transferase (SPINDLY family)